MCGGGGCDAPVWQQDRSGPDVKPGTVEQIKTDTAEQGQAGLSSLQSGALSSSFRPVLRTPRHTRIRHQGKWK